MRSTTGFKCIEDFIRETSTWNNHFRDDWFRPANPLGRPRDAGECPDALELYEAAIKELQAMAELVKNGQGWLAKGQAFAKKSLAEKKASKRPKAEQSSEVPGSDEEQCSVMDELEKL